MQGWFGKAKAKAKEKADTSANVFGTAFPRRALVSAGTADSLELAEVLHELGYQVDAINPTETRAPDYSQFELLCGWGEPLANLFRQEAVRLPRTVLFSAGSYLPVVNGASLRRLAEVYRRRGVWLPGSARLGNQGLGVESVVDGLLVLGNEATADTYRPFTSRPIHPLPPCFDVLADPAEILAARELAGARRNFLWCSGSGLVHQGLDLALQAFARHPDLHLHVFGALEQEPGFLRAFDRELNHSPNIHLEGRLEHQSPGFRATLLASAFVLAPSCAECEVPVLDLCGNGGLVPLLTRSCGIDLMDFGIRVEDTTVEAVEAALLQAQSLSDAELDWRTRGSAAFFRREHSPDQQHRRLKQALQAILQ